MNAVNRTQKWTPLSHDDDIVTYRVRSRDGDEFILDFDDIVRASRIATSQKDFLQQYSDLLEHTNRWLHSQSEKVDRAYLSLGLGKVDFVVFQKGTRFDREFDESLVELDIEIANRSEFDLIQLDVLALPNCPDEDAASFVPRGSTYVWCTSRNNVLSATKG